MIPCPKCEAEEQLAVRDTELAALRAELAKRDSEISSLRIVFAEASHSAGPTTVHVEMLQKELADAREALADAQAELERMRKAGLGWGNNEYQP